MLLQPVLLGFAIANFRPTHDGARQLRTLPAIHLVESLLDNGTTVELLKLLPSRESSAWAPCVGHVAEFAHKRCTLLRGARSPPLRATFAAVEATYGIDTRRLADEGLPVIQYLPGGGAVGVHGDEGADGRVPNATIVIYLTDSVGEDGGQTFFPMAKPAELRVTPRAGSALSFINVDADGRPDAASRHGVSPVGKQSPHARVVVQIPIRSASVPHEHIWEAYAEHVSGNKHTIHMGLMLLVLIGFGGYYLWEHMYGPKAQAVLSAGQAAMMRVVSKVTLADGADRRM